MTEIPIESVAMRKLKEIKYDVEGKLVALYEETGNMEMAWRRFGLEMETDALAEHQAYDILRAQGVSRKK